MIVPKCADGTTFNGYEMLYHIRPSCALLIFLIPCVQIPMDKTPLMHSKWDNHIVHVVLL